MSTQHDMLSYLTHWSSVNGSVHLNVVELESVHRASVHVLREKEELDNGHPLPLP